MLPLEHSAILSNCIMLPCVIKIFVLSIVEWPLKTGFTIVRIVSIFCSQGSAAVKFLKTITGQKQALIHKLLHLLVNL